MTYSVTAISWGDWRAEFVTTTDDGKHVVRIRPHRTTAKAPVVYTELVVTDDGELGLREAMYTLGRRQGRTQHLLDAHPQWYARLAARDLPGVPV